MPSRASSLPPTEPRQMPQSLACVGVGVGCWRVSLAVRLRLLKFLQVAPKDFAAWVVERTCRNLGRLMQQGRAEPVGALMGSAPSCGHNAPAAHFCKVQAPRSKALRCWQAFSRALLLAEGRWALDQTLPAAR